MVSFATLSRWKSGFDSRWHDYPLLDVWHTRIGSAMNLTISTVCKLSVSKASRIVYIWRDVNVENLFLYSYSQ